MFLLIFDDSAALAAEKITNAIGLYHARFGAAPTQVLVNEADLAAVEGVRVESRFHILRNNFWLGQIVEEGRK
jgi:hypothetical protein